MPAGCSKPVPFEQAPKGRDEQIGSSEQGKAMTEQTQEDDEDQ